MAKHWHIATLETGKELALHEIFVDAGIPCWTPFKLKFESLSTGDRKNRFRRVSYAVALYEGFLFFQLPEGIGQKTLDSIKAQTDYFYNTYHKVIGNDVYLYALRDIEIQNCKAYLDKLADNAKKRKAGSKLEHKHIKARGYCPVKDARKRKDKLRGQEPVVIPIFEEGDTVRVVEGFLEGFDLTVLSANDDKDRIKIEWMVFGQPNEVIANAEDFHKVA